MKKTNKLVLLVLVLGVLGVKVTGWYPPPKATPLPTPDRYTYCQTDYACVSNCTQRGYQYGLCNSLCTWCQ